MQTITVPATRSHNRLLAVLVAAAALAIVVSLTLVHFVQGSDTHSVRFAPAQVVPARALAPQPGISSCQAHRAC